MNNFCGQCGEGLADGKCTECNKPWAWAGVVDPPTAEQRDPHLLELYGKQRILDDSISKLEKFLDRLRDRRESILWKQREYLRRSYADLPNQKAPGRASDLRKFAKEFTEEDARVELPPVPRGSF